MFYRRLSQHISIICSSFFPSIKLIFTQFFSIFSVFLIEMSCDCLLQDSFILLFLSHTDHQVHSKLKTFFYSANNLFSYEEQY